jgi:DNA-binding response OmpR family regulator
MTANILLVEESASERKRLTAILEEAAHHVTAVDNVVAARCALLRTNVDLAVASTTADDGADIDLIHWLSRQSPALAVPILVLASDSTAKTRLLARQAGASDYLARPFFPEYLLHRISNLLMHRECKPSIPPQGFARRVLVVDDSPTYGFALTDALQKDGHDVAFAETGKEALAFLESNRIDAVVVDVFLPDVNGVEVCRRIKSNARTASLPVLVLTGREKSAMRTEAEEANADDFAVKATDFDAIRHKVRMLLVRAPNRKISVNRIPAGGLNASATPSPIASTRIRDFSAVASPPSSQDTSSARLRVAPKLCDPLSTDPLPSSPLAANAEGFSAGSTSADLLAVVVSMSGLSELVARSSVETACRRLDLDPHALSRKDIPRVVASLERTLQLFLPPTEARQRLAALNALAR